MTDPRQAEVWGKKQEVADRTINERKYCKPCDYYYSEMWTCPICYGDDRATERIIKLLEEQLAKHTLPDGTVYIEFQIITDLIALIKGENKPFITTKQAEELTNEMLEE